LTLHHLDYAGACAALNGNASYALLIASSFSTPSIRNSTTPTVAHNTTLSANKTITKLSNNAQSMQVVQREDDPWVLVDRILELKQPKQPGSRETHTKERYECSFKADTGCKACKTLLIFSFDLNGKCVIYNNLHNHVSLIRPQQSEKHGNVGPNSIDNASILFYMNVIHFILELIITIQRECLFNSLFSTTTAS
jgi:hypothetical protein